MDQYEAAPRPVSDVVLRWQLTCHLLTSGISMMWGTLCTQTTHDVGHMCWGPPQAVQVVLLTPTASLTLNPGTSVPTSRRPPAVPSTLDYMLRAQAHPQGGQVNRSSATQRPSFLTTTHHPSRQRVGRRPLLSPTWSRVHGSHNQAAQLLRTLGRQIC